MLALTGAGPPAGVLHAQSADSAYGSLVERLASMTAVTGFEQAMVDTLMDLVPGAGRDRAGNAVVTLGAGARRLVACPVDEPGYVVGGIGNDGYVTLRRAAGRGSPTFDSQLQGQRVTILGRRGPVPGVVGVRSIHLTRSREPPAPSTFTVDSAWVDLGAASAAEVTSLGVGLLSPVTLTKQPHRYGRDLLPAPSVGRRAACAALIAAVRQATAEQGMVPGSGSVVAAFIVEQELSLRGLATLSNTLGPFTETLLVDAGPGTLGELLRESDAELAARWPRLGPVTRWSLPLRFPGTPVETVTLSDAAALREALVRWIRGER